MSELTSNDDDAGRDVQDRTSRPEHLRLRYLPSAQVVRELAGISSLGTLAEELRACLTESESGHSAAAGQP